MADTGVPLNPKIREVTERIVERSGPTRQRYLAHVEAARAKGTARGQLSCTNLAHGFAASGNDKPALRELRRGNVAIVTAYNDMLSAHQPLENYPALIKRAVREVGAVAQVAGGVPAMCDGVTQGQAGMELSLFSRDVIAMSTAVALSHNMFDAALCLGVCDKIVPGLLMGALAFGHLPTIFIPAGPMRSGSVSNKEKARVRQLYAEGKLDQRALLESESLSYHSAGTCTFYGTANSNQMLMEIMGLHMPGAAFVHPGTPLRDALTIAAARAVASSTTLGDHYRPLAKVIDERSFVNAIIGLLATGGSTNHTLHLIAMAHCAGIQINWDDFNDLSDVTPLLARVYPNGAADVNRFQWAGGMAFLIRELLQAGMLHGDVETVAGHGLSAYTQHPVLNEEGKLQWVPTLAESQDANVLRPASNPFSHHGGMRLLNGNLGRAVIKTSAMPDDHHVIEAPALVFDDQADVLAAFRAGKLARDFIAVICFQGPRANGMPELHQLSPSLASLQSKGFKVALVTDGRMSGASGSVPAAIHVSPEALSGGPLARVRDGDMIRLDCHSGRLEALVNEEEWNRRELRQPDLTHNEWGTGRELFSNFRRLSSEAEAGAMSCMS
jgi:phosphogluconate dehydratase